MPENFTRMRRLRQSDWSRRMVQETNLTPNDFIWPVFICEGKNQVIPIESMPNVFRYSIDELLKKLNEVKQLSIPAIALFPHIEVNLKSEGAEEALNSNNLMCRAIKAIKDKFGDAFGVMCDVALDPYTVSGHDGITNDAGVVLNDRTVEILVGQARVMVQAGCDIIGPSDMMDGRVLKIRNMVEDEGFSNVIIMSYTAKYASNFYAPFRDAVGSTANLKNGSKATYQMNYLNSREAIRQAIADEAQGADVLMVKPATLYLDVIKEMASNSNLPIAAYHVSGEYSMMQNAINNGIIHPNAMVEALSSIKRAGANVILSYASLDFCKEFL